jgi:hypothetical protein
LYYNFEKNNVKLDNICFYNFWKCRYKQALVEELTTLKGIGKQKAKAIV